MDVDGLILLAVVLVLALPVTVIVLLVKVVGLARRMRQLETAVAALGPGRARVPDAVVVPEPAVSEAAVSEAAVPEAAAMPVAEVPPVAAEGAGQNAGGAAVFDPWAAKAVTAQDAPPDGAEGLPAAPLSRGIAPPRRMTALDGLERCLRENWVYVISGVSLALAGVFLVQYGIEQGLLPPALRVAAGVVFGLGLVAGGEWVRRRYGDGEGDVTAYLPSVFSGAGVVSVFAALVAARQMYGLIGPEAGFAGLALTAAGAVLLGWFNGAFMVALGLVGAVVAPFVVGGSADDADWLYAYFALVAAVGLAVDTMRRWAWVSVLAVVLGFLGGWLLRQGGGGAEGLGLMGFALVPLAVLIPARRLVPDQAGPGLLGVILSKDNARPPFPAALAAGTVAAASVLLAAGGGVYLPYVLLALMALGLAAASDRAEGLQDLALLPALAFVLRLLGEGVGDGALRAVFLQGAYRAPETAAPVTVSVLLGLAALVGLGLVWRSRRGPLYPLVLSGAGALVAPVSALVLEVFWMPSAVMGAYPWALHVVALAALMTGIVLLFGREGDMRRAAHYTLAALSLIALALFLILTEAALNVALAVLVVVAAGLDRRFRLPEMGWFLVAGVMVIGFRLSVYPGIGWAIDAPWGAMAVAFAAPLAGFALALRLLRGLERDVARAFLESGFAGAAAVFADIVVYRMLDDVVGSFPFDTHWGLALMAYPWLVLALVQLYRAGLGGWLRFLRYGIALVAGLLFLLPTLATLFSDNPLLGGEVVIGPLVLDSMLLAYVLPGVTLIVVRRWLGHLPLWLRRGMLGAGVALCGLYAALEIRRFWRGDDLSVAGVTQPELYSYTVALLLLGAVLLWQAIAKGSPLLRRMAMAVIAVTVAKVFLIDISGLSGLIRVFSFLALGLSLAGLAWLNRWAAARMGQVR